MIFHRVLEKPDKLFPNAMDATRFERHLEWLRRWFNIMPLADAITQLSSGCLPPRPLVLTFDDGYADNYTVALPILKQYRAHATFFIATGYLDGGRMWNDTVIEAVRRCAYPVIDLDDLDLGKYSLSTAQERRDVIGLLLSRLKYLPHSERQAKADAIGLRCGAALPQDLMLTSAQLRRLHRAGMSIGAHTVTHPILKCLPEDVARREIEDGKNCLERTLGEGIRYFAYPNGKPGKDYDASHVRMVRDLGFDAALSTAWGVARVGCDIWQLPRFTPWDRHAMSYGIRLARNMTRLAYPRA